MKKLCMHMVIGLYFIAYITSQYHQNTWGGEMLSPLGALIASATLFRVYVGAQSLRFGWLGLSMACLGYAMGDIVWAICDLLLGFEPSGLIMVNSIYLIPNILMAVAGAAYLVRLVRSFNKIQLLLDMVCISSSSLVLFWITVMDSDFSIWIGYLTDGNQIIMFISMCLDLFLIVGIVFWALSIGKKGIPSGPALTMLSCGLYALTDLTWCRAYFHGQYAPSSLLEVGYIAAFMAIACGGILTLKQDQRLGAQEFYQQTNNIGPGRKGWILLIFPIILFFQKGWGNADFGLLIIVIIVHQIVSNYVQNSIRNEQQLQYEQKMNTLLESKIMERTRELEKTNKTLEYISKHDFITKIYNSWHFKKTFEEMIDYGGADMECVLLYIDVDRFKDINDTYGHDIGDRILVQLSRRFMKWNTYEALLARLGGDEFVFAIQGRFNRQDIEKMARSILECCNKTIVIDEHQFNINVSIGIAIYPQDGTTRNCMMKNADIAMYNAKQNGANQFSFFASAMTEKIVKKQEIEMLLKGADFDTEFELYYQPQFNIQKNELVGAEALIRWHSPEKGNIMPGEFIEIAEETGFIKQIGEWVMHEAAQQVAEWNNEYGRNLQMGINISPKQLDSMNFISIIEQLISTYKLRPEWLDIEITESIAMKGEKTVTDIFNALAELKVSGSIDDFGTGYSSLSYIQQFSFDRLKIAKPLIDGISTDASTGQIVKAIINMAQALSVKTIAEGVENYDQLEILKGLGCDEIQGYIFSRPIPAQEFERKYLKKSNVVLFERAQHILPGAKYGHISG